eukprot:Partr_v1_DN23151_c0_g2_i1_m43959 putative Conserved hypothetical protein
MNFWRRCSSLLPTTLLILDSSFNPPTRAHLHLIERAVSKLPQVDRLLLLLATKNADKASSSQVDYDQRLQMMNIMASHSSLRDRVDIATTSHSLFLDKNREIRTEYGNDCIVYYLMGMDTLVRVFDMKYYPRAASIQEALYSLFDGRSYLMVANRKSFDSEFAMGNEYVLKLEIDNEMAAISSTKCRDALKEKRLVEAKQMMCEDVVDFCLKSNRYH